MKIKINEIISFLENENIDYKYYGDYKFEINRPAAISELTSNSISWISEIDKFEISNIDQSLNLLIVTDKLPDNSNTDKINFIISGNPRVAYFEIVNHFFVVKQYNQSISPTSIVETKKIGANVTIGHNSYVSGDASIGDNVIIHNNVSIEGHVSIGNNCTIGSGTVIGTFGFGYYKTQEGHIKKVPDLGGVIIGNRVEIGANTCIDRGTLSNTIIEDDAKIDNLCHIGHNVHIGVRCFITAGAVICGSAVIGNDVYIGPNATIDRIKMMEHSRASLGSVVIRDVPPNTTVSGNFAVEHLKYLRFIATQVDKNGG